MEIRRLVVSKDVVYSEAGAKAARPVTRALGIAVIANPNAGKHAQDLSPMFDIGAQLAELLMPQLVPLLGGPAVSYGKGAIVGVNGDAEHAAAICHPKMGKPMRAALGGGEVQIMFELMPSAMPHVKSGRMRALAVTSKERSPVMPELPTVAESGLPGYEVGSWFGLCAPGKTPKAIVDKISADVAAAHGSGDMKQRILGLGAQPVVMKPEEFSRFVRAEIDKWSKVVKDSGATAK